MHDQSRSTRFHSYPPFEARNFLRCNSCGWTDARDAHPQTLGKHRLLPERASGCSPFSHPRESQSTTSRVPNAPPRATFCAPPRFTSLQPLAQREAPRLLWSGRGAAVSWRGSFGPALHSGTVMMRLGLRFAVLSVLLLATGGVRAADEARPNVLWITCEDL